jgi:hypothetical protein
MRKLLVAVLGTMVFMAVGCQSDGGGDKMSSKSSGDAMKASADACPHCPGAQKATADGKCPMCGMKVSSASSSHKSGGAGASAASASGDACSHCAGVQTATAEGKCSACGMEVAKK